MIKPKINPCILYIKPNDGSLTDIETSFVLNTWDKLKGIPLVMIAPGEEKKSFEGFNGRLMAPVYRWYIDPKHFESRESYSLMTTSSWFWEKLQALGYTHALFCYKDCWVFGDGEELKFWCSLGYGFIGAPHFEDYDYMKNPTSFINSMNGGFCLRDVKINLQASRIVEAVYPGLTERGHDDVFMCHLLHNMRERMPDPITAASFAWEQGGFYLQQLIISDRPFGVHDPFAYEDQYPEEIIREIKSAVNIK